MNQTTVFDKKDYNLGSLLEQIGEGRIGLPDIQRPFVWKTKDVRDLFDSMYRGFPVGYLLFWSSGVEGQERQIGTNGKQRAPSLLIVDGQQRLTSLYAVIKNRKILTESYEKKHLHIAFRPSDETFAVADAAIRRDATYIADISELWTEDQLLIDYIGDFLERLREQRDLADDERKQISRAISRLHNLTNYPFTALELGADVDEEDVAEVFVRINSEGVNLNQADFILTLMSVFWDEGRQQLEAFCRDAVRPSEDGQASAYNRYVGPDPDELLRVSIGVGFRRARLKFAYSILRGKDLETGDVSEERRAEQFETLRSAQDFALNLTNWHEYFKALALAGFRSDGMITSHMNLFFCYLMFLIGKRDYWLKGYDLRCVIARWFFMCNISRRYTGSSESRMESDLARLRDTETAEDFVRLLDGIIESTLTDDFWNITLPDGLDTSSYNSPTLYAYHAALNVLGARALFSNLSITELLDPDVNAKKRGVERHHLFPKNYLKKQDIGNAPVNHIANRAYVEWPDNIEIADRPPAAYFPEYACRFDEEERAQMREWHALPEGWEHMDYRDFLEERRLLIAQVTRKGFEKLTANASVLQEQFA